MPGAQRRSGPTTVLAVRPVFICSAFEHEVLEIEGHPLDDCVGFKTTGEPVNLLKSALLRRRPFTHLGVEECMGGVGV